MYRIVSEGKIVALCDAPRFVRQKEESGAWVRCAAADAQALSVSGALYNLPGQSHVADAPEAEAQLVDGGEQLFAGYVDRAKYQAEISALEDALCEMDATKE